MNPAEMPSSTLHLNASRTWDRLCALPSDLSAARPSALQLNFQREVRSHAPVSELLTGLAIELPRLNGLADFFVPILFSAREANKGLRNRLRMSFHQVLSSSHLLERANGLVTVSSHYQLLVNERSRHSASFVHYG